MTRKQIPPIGDDEDDSDDGDNALWSETRVTEAIHEANRHGIDPAEYIRTRGNRQSNAPYAFRTIYRKEMHRNLSDRFRSWWRAARGRRT